MIKLQSDPLIYARGTTIVIVRIIAGQLGKLFASRTNLEPDYRLILCRNKWFFIGFLS